MHEKDFMPEAFLRFKFLGVKKLPLSLKPHSMRKIVCFQMHEKGVMPEAFLRFKFVGVKKKKLAPSLKLHFTWGVFPTICCLTST